MAGSAIWRELRDAGFTRLVGRAAADLDLRDRSATFRFFEAVRPQCVLLAAGRVGGILATATRPVDFLSDNLRVQVNVLDAALALGVERLLFVGSAASYPAEAGGPMPERSLLTGPLDRTSNSDGIAKIAGMMHVQAARRQYGVGWISVVPTSLYGPQDNFDTRTASVVAGLLGRINQAARDCWSEVTVWGSGRPRRDFLHVDDLARACLLLLDRYDDPEPINIGTGQATTVHELAEMIARLVGYDGELVFDAAKPDGPAERLLDVSRLGALGFRPRIGLAEGLAGTCDWLRCQLDRGQLAALQGPMVPAEAAGDRPGPVLAADDTHQLALSARRSSLARPVLVPDPGARLNASR